MIKQIQNYFRKVNIPTAALAFVLGFVLTGFVTQIIKALGY